MFKCKIRIPDDITYGPANPDELLAIATAKDLMDKGYRKTSNAYCHINRIDREDWLDVLATAMHCSRADFYCLNGGGIKDNWRDFYIRTFSKDQLTVHPLVLRHMKAYW